MNPVIETKNLGLKHGRFQALKNVSLQVPLNGVTAILGRNGAGKSTLLDACLGLNSPARVSSGFSAKTLGRKAQSDFASTDLYRECNRSMTWWFSSVDKSAILGRFETYHERAQIGLACESNLETTSPKFLLS